MQVLKSFEHDFKALPSSCRHRIRLRHTNCFDAELCSFAFRRAPAPSTSEFIMHSLKSILVATNLTAANEQLFETVMNFSWSFGTRLTVLHVLPRPALGMLDVYCQDLESKLTGASEILMGSTTRRVLQQLPCSLLTVKEDDVLSADYEDTIEDIRWLYDQAQVALETNNDELALRKFDAVLRLNPFHIPALEDRAQACERLGEFERADRCRRRLDQLQRYPVLT